MKLSASDAALLSPAERTLVQSSGPWHVKDLSTAIKRTRRLRDKARDLLQRQTVATRRSGKGANLKAPNVRSQARARVFERVLEDFRRQLAALDTESSRAMREVGADADADSGKRGKAGDKSTQKTAARKTSAAKRSTTRTPAGRKTPGKTSAGKKPAAKASATKATATRKSAAKSDRKTSAGRKSAATKPAPKNAAAKRSAPAKSPAKASRKPSTAKQPAMAPSAVAKPPGKRETAAPASAAKRPTSKRAKAPVVVRVHAGEEPETHGPASGPPQESISSKARMPIPRELGTPFGGGRVGKASRRTRAGKSRRG